MQKSITRPVWAGIFALIVILIAGSLLIGAYAEKERQRDLDAWSIRLGQVAETRVKTIEDWLARQRQSLDELADNASLQLYLWQLSQRDSGETAAEPAQLAYLRNLILASAERYGYSPGDQQPLITANVPRRHASGLALFDAHQKLVVSTAGMPEIGTALKTVINQARETGRAAFSQLTLDAHDRVLFGIAVPVPLVLGAGAGSGNSGVILGVHDAARTLFPLLDSGVPLTGGDESLLLRKEDRQVLYLSPTRGGGIPTRKSLPLDRSNLAAAVAVNEPGRFGLFRNYLDHPVLATSRTLPSLPDWVLNQQADAGEALQESDRHRRFIITSFSLLLFFFAATLVAAWRHGSSVRALHDAEALRSQSLALRKQTELLHAVTDNTESLVLLLDDQQQILFANTRIAQRVGADAQTLSGQSLAAVIGPANAQAMQQAIEQMLADSAIQRCTRELNIGTQTGTFQCSLVPVDQVGERFNAMLLVLQDITELQRAQQKHATLLRRLIDSLMHVVDLHDPYSAHHSARMVEVANAVGRELQLSAADAQTLDMAASLANLGKIFVPREVLTKTEPLTEAEQNLLQRHVQYGVEMLEDLEFEGRVLDTIRQKQEHLDGSGYPAALKGDDILLTARILAVANAFVALVSPRAYRDAISIQAALDRLLRDAGSRYDRHVIAALFHVAENRSDWSEWQAGN